MSQIWRKIRHLRKGKALIKSTAKQLIDWRLFETTIHVIHKEGKYHNYILLRIKSRQTSQTTQIAFNTESIMQSYNPESIIKMEIEIQLQKIDLYSRNAPEYDRR